MAIKPVLRMGHPLLREVARPLTLDEILSEETNELLQDMVDTMKERGGIGLAAPQIGISVQAAIVEIKDSIRYPNAPNAQLTVIFNPVITILDDTLQGFWEGCLSVPGLRGFVKRPKKIQIDYLDRNAHEQTLIAEEFLATVYQHELDHLFGILYVDKIADRSKFCFEDEYRQFFLEK